MTVDPLPIVGEWREWRATSMCATGQHEGAVGARLCAGGCWDYECWCICHLPPDSNVSAPRPVITWPVVGGVV